jgi:Concanavalin A-like lectin/glucanases superfamily
MSYLSPQDRRRRAFGVVLSFLLVGVSSLSWGGASAIAANGGTALQLNGTSQYVRFGTAAGLGAAAFTLETWFKRTGTGVGTGTGTGGIASAIPLVTKGRSQSDGSNVDMNYFLGIDASSGKLVADFEEGTGGTTLGLNHPISGTTTVTSNVWHHAAATYDGTWRLYLDGVLDGSLAVNRPARSDSIQWAALGSALNSTGAASGFFAGAIDEARIWNVARSAAQIVATKDVELTSATAGLLGRWSMNEGSGTTVANTAGTANINGTLVGSPTWTTGFPIPDVGGPPPANRALQLNGTSQYVRFGTAAGLGAAAFTL